MSYGGQADAGKKEHIWSLADHNQLGGHCHAGSPPADAQAITAVSASPAAPSLSYGGQADDINRLNLQTISSPSLSYGGQADVPTSAGIANTGLSY